MTIFDPKRQQVLLDAVAAADISAAERLGSRRESDLAGRRLWRSPLVLAARNGDGAMVDWLLANGAFAGGAAGNGEEHAFAAAIKRGDGAIGLRIIEAIDWFDDETCAAGVLALAQGPNDDPNVLADLLARSRRRPPVSNDALAAALAAAAGSGHQKLVAALVRQGARADSVASAASQGRTKLLRFLASEGASVNCEDPDTGETPLHAAVRAPRKVTETVETLLQLGCAVRPRSRGGQTAAELAESLGRLEVAALIRRLAPDCGPRWMREARARNICEYVFYLTKALGLGFNPDDRERPILWEGDYLGFGYQNTAAEALALWQRDFAPVPDAAAATRWFLPFLERLVRAEDFGLGELEAAAPWFRAEHCSPD